MALAGVGRTPERLLESLPIIPIMVNASGARITPANRAEQEAEKICKARAKVDQAFAW